MLLGNRQTTTSCHSKQIPISNASEATVGINIKISSFTPEVICQLQLPIVNVGFLQLVSSYACLFSLPTPRYFLHESISGLGHPDKFLVLQSGIPVQPR